MNITFLIGNGFDIACGLKTKYCEFINYYIVTPSKNDYIADFKKHIKKDVETWADAEVAFGEYTQMYNPNSISAFRECYDDFIFELANYLSREEDRFNNLSISQDAISDFSTGIKEFDRTLPEDTKEEITELYDSMTNNERVFNMLIFNYTQVFERFINRIDATKFELSYLLNNKQCLNEIGSVLYAHNNLSNRPLIFGVDHDSQIANKDFVSVPKFKRSIVKPEANSQLRKRASQNCADIISNSDIICIYGMSIGATDTIWWDRIVEWLQRDTKHLLIQYAWAPSCIRDSVGNYIDTLDECREYLYRKLFSSENDVRTVFDQIHIEVNIDLFGVEKNIAPRLKDEVRHNVFNGVAPIRA